MSYRHWLFSAVLFGTMMSTLSVSVSAKELAPNSADLQYSVNVPTMQIAINPGGGGCVGVETWDPTAGKCTEAEYIRDTVRVVQVSPSPATVASDGTASILSATVRDGLGRLAPAGIEVLWSATLGTLTTTRSITNSSGVAFASISSKVAGASTIYAKTTVSGNASTGVTFKAMNPIILSFTE
ncbi:Ig-like domain-containing protein, partial [Pseudomonas sp. W22_MBD1_FP4]|uniref:Ig-like domain-containing protein n=1 Tax=Pseudomonas sp. W22_MBD1_FP4 TaxID=3240272 RepID=UPI003F9C5B7E